MQTMTTSPARNVSRAAASPLPPRPAPQPPASKPAGQGCALKPGKVAA